MTKIIYWLYRLFFVVLLLVLGISVLIFIQQDCALYDNGSLMGCVYLLLPISVVSCLYYLYLRRFIRSNRHDEKIIKLCKKRHIWIKFILLFSMMLIAMVVSIQFLASLIL